MKVAVLTCTNLIKRNVWSNRF